LTLVGHCVDGYLIQIHDSEISSNNGSADQSRFRGRTDGSDGGGWDRTQALGGEKMSLTISLLLNWLEMGVLLAILFRLSSTFQLIASTQCELRRASHDLGQRRAAELGIDRACDRPGNPFDSSSPHARVHAESSIGRHHLAHLSAGLNP
jgi:hypothetical protein